MGWIIIKVINSHLSINTQQPISWKMLMSKKVSICSSCMLGVMFVHYFESCVEEMPYHCGIMNWGICSREIRLEVGLVKSSQTFFKLWFLSWNPILFEFFIGSKKGDLFWWFTFLVLNCARDGILIGYLALIALISP